MSLQKESMFEPVLKHVEIISYFCPETTMEMAHVALWIAT